MKKGFADPQIRKKLKIDSDCDLWGLYYASSFVLEDRAVVTLKLNLNIMFACQKQRLLQTLLL